jgi:D-galactarolactone cycloisomerase
VVADCPKWDCQRANAFCREATQLGYAWVEEPLPMDDYDGLARLCAAVA